MEGPCAAAAARAGSPPAREAPASAPGPTAASSQVLDLSQHGLLHLGGVLNAPTLKQLYLQRNALCSVPGDLFQLLPSLTWLDLRHNRIEALPPGIGSHRYLKTLLLERNPIRMLPVELGSVRTLQALGLRHCPVEFPPQLVLQKGLATILSFLRACAAGPASRATPPPAETGLAELPHPCWDLAEACAPGGEAWGSQRTPGSRPTGTVGAWPRAGRRERSERSGSPESWEDWPSKEEIRRFWKLRQEIVGGQPKALGHQLLATELPPDLQALLLPPEEARPHLRRKTPSFGGVLPGLAPAHQGRAGAGRLGQRRALVPRALREQQALTAQRRRECGVLREGPQPRRQEEERGKVAPPRQRLPFGGQRPDGDRRLQAQVASKTSLATDPPDSEETQAHPPGRRRRLEEKPPRARRELRACSSAGRAEGRPSRRPPQKRDRRGVSPGTAALGETRKLDLDTVSICPT